MCSGVPSEGPLGQVAARAPGSSGWSQWPACDCVAPRGLAYGVDPMPKRRALSFWAETRLGRAAASGRINRAGQKVGQGIPGQASKLGKALVGSQYSGQGIPRQPGNRARHLWQPPKLGKAFPGCHESGIQASAAVYLFPESYEIGLSCLRGFLMQRAHSGSC